MSGHHIGIDAVEKHFGRNIVGCDRELCIGISGKNYQTYLVIVHLVDELLQNEFGALQTADTPGIIGR